MDIKNELIKNLNDASDSIVDIVKDGLLEPTYAFLYLKKVEHKAKEMREEIKDLTIEELSSIGLESKSYKMQGGTLELRNAAGRWDFSHIDEIVKLEQELKDLKERAKAAYKMSLKGSILITDDGEEITPAIYKEGKESIAVKLD
jgi:uncharacterized protein (UPF0335 family)